MNWYKISSFLDIGDLVTTSVEYRANEVGVVLNHPEQRHQRWWCHVNWGEKVQGMPVEYLQKFSGKTSGSIPGNIKRDLSSQYPIPLQDVEQYRQGDLVQFSPSPKYPEPMTGMVVGIYPANNSLSIQVGNMRIAATVRMSEVSIVPPMLR